MNKVQILLGACIMFSSGIMATSIEKPRATANQIDQANDADDDTDDEDPASPAKEANPDLVKSVEEALKAIAKGSPDINEDSLRVWKNFTATSKPVHYTYRSWGRQIIMWLKSEKKMAFQSKEQVGEVFKILWRKGLISKNAVVVLMVDVWSYLVYLEGAPSWEKRPEGGDPKRDRAPGASSAQLQSNERST